MNFVVSLSSLFLPLSTLHWIISITCRTEEERHESFMVKDILPWSHYLLMEGPCASFLYLGMQRSVNTQQNVDELDFVVVNHEVYINKLEHYIYFPHLLFVCTPLLQLMCFTLCVYICILLLLSIIHYYNVYPAIFLSLNLPFCTKN
jgi:hypothetical protein